MLGDWLSVQLINALLLFSLHFYLRLPHSFSHRTLHSLCCHLFPLPCTYHLTNFPHNLHSHYRPTLITTSYSLFLNLPQTYYVCLWFRKWVWIESFLVLLHREDHWLRHGFWLLMRWGLLWVWMRICICWNGCLWWIDGVLLFCWSFSLKLHFRLSVIIKHNRQRIGSNISRLLNFFLCWVVINELPVPVRRFTVKERHRSWVLFAPLKHNLLMRIRSQSPYQRLSLFWDKRRKWLHDGGVDLWMLVLGLRLLESKRWRLSRWLLPNGSMLQIITVNIIQRINDGIAMWRSPVTFVVVSWMLFVRCLIIGMRRSLRAFIRNDWMVIIELALSMVILVVCGYGVVIWIPLPDDGVDDCLIVRLLLWSFGSDGIGLILLVDGFVGDGLGFYWCLVGDCFVTLLLHDDLFEELILLLIVLSSNLINWLLA